MDLSTAPVAREALSDALEEPADLVLDLADLDYVDSTGLSLLVSGRKRAQASGTRFALQNPQLRIRRLLEIARLDDFFDLEDYER
jgi:anti-sigma B factor antagonist